MGYFSGEMLHKGLDLKSDLEQSSKLIQQLRAHRDPAEYPRRFGSGK